MYKIFIDTSMTDFDTKISQEEKLFNPEEQPFGLSYQDYVIAWWKWLISIPEERSPDRDETGERTADDQDPESPVFFLSTGSPEHKVERICEVPNNKGILIPLMPVEVSDKEVEEIERLKIKPPLIEFMRKKAKKDQDGVTTLYLKIDDKEYQMEILRKYRIKQTDVFEVNFPKNNVYGVKKLGPAKSVADGYYILCKPLEKGDHIISWYSEAICKDNINNTEEPNCIDSNFKQDIKYTLRVN